MIRTGVVLSVLMLIVGISPAADDNLGATLRKSGWDRMIGTWVDAETKGEKYKSRCFWRFKDRVIESLNEEPQNNRKEISLMGYNPKRDEVFHVSADNKGGSTIGKWTFNKDEAILDLGFVTPGKEEGLLQIRYKLVDDDTMIATVVLPKPIVIKMVRVKKQGKDEANANSDE